MAAVTTGKIARKYMAHFLDSGSLCGGTSGYQIPFTVNYVGERKKGTYNVETGKFTAATSSVNASSTGK